MACGACGWMVCSVLEKSLSPRIICCDVSGLFGVGGIVGGHDLDLLSEHTSCRVHFVGSKLGALHNLDAAVGGVPGVGRGDAYLDRAGESRRRLRTLVAGSEDDRPDEGE